jgi:hypothetical protein
MSTKDKEHRAAKHANVTARFDSLNIEIRETMQKRPGWLPLEVFEFIQCGYPMPDHGELILRTDAGTDADNRLYPPLSGETKGWCYAPDVAELEKSRQALINALEDRVCSVCSNRIGSGQEKDYPCCKDVRKVLAEAKKFNLWVA